MFKDARHGTGYSTERAALDLHIGTRTLTNYENGHTLTPPDVALKMSEVYGQPKLSARYCSEYCPIGQKYAYKTKERGLAEAALSIIKEFNDVKALKEKLIAIAADGVIADDEVDDWEEIIKQLDELGKEIETIKWIARSQKQKPAQAVAERRAQYQTKRAASAAK